MVPGRAVVSHVRRARVVDQQLACPESIPKRRWKYCVRRLRGSCEGLFKDCPAAIKESPRTSRRGESYVDKMHCGRVMTAQGILVCTVEKLLFL